MSQLRKELASSNGALLATSGGGYVLHVDREQVDVGRFERGLQEGERALENRDAQRACEELREALGLWRGAPLSDFTYQPFAQGEIARLQEMRLVALEARIDADLALGHHTQVVGELEALVREHPMREAVRAQLMIALYRCGRQADALDVYREGRKLISEELGLEPGPALRDVEAKVLAQSPDLAAPVVPATLPAAAPVAPATLPAAAPPAPAPPRRRAPGFLIAAAGVLLCAAALAAILGESNGGSTARASPPLDLARNSVALIDPRSGRPRLGLPLSGRPTDLAAGARRDRRGRDGRIQLAHDRGRRRGSDPAHGAREPHAGGRRGRRGRCVGGRCAARARRCTLRPGL